VKIQLSSCLTINFLFICFPVETSSTQNLSCKTLAAESRVKFLLSRKNCLTFEVILLATLTYFMFSFFISFSLSINVNISKEKKIYLLLFLSQTSRTFSHLFSEQTSRKRQKEERNSFVEKALSYTMREISFLWLSLSREYMA
jgi:hypothetical protein